MAPRTWGPRFWSKNKGVGGGGWGGGAFLRPATDYVVHYIEIIVLTPVQIV